MAGGASCGGSAKARKLRDPRLRALVFLRDGLTTDSTGRTLPGHERAAEVDKHPGDPDHHQAQGSPANG